MKPRHHLYLDDELTQRLEQLAARPGASKSAIVADALKAWFTRGAAIEIDPVIRFPNTVGNRAVDSTGKIDR